MSQTPLRTTHAGLPALKYLGGGRSGGSVIIWLHGIGERGKDPSIVANYGLPAALVAGRAFTSCDVVCPQIPDDMQWESSLVQSIVLHAMSSYNRVVLMGYSLGGRGVLEAVADLGAFCSFCVSIAIGDPRAPTARQDGVHLLSIQGEQDLKAEVSRFVARVRQLGGVADEVIVQGGNHFISESALWQSELQSALASRGISFRAHAA